MKHSRRLAIFFSLLPGAGHMYLGLIKQGIELMLLFFFSIFASEMAKYFTVFIPVIWCYSIFSVNEKTKQEALEGKPLEDSDLPIFKSSDISDLIKGNSTQKYIAYIIIIMGIFSLIDNVIVPFGSEYFSYEIMRGIKDTAFSILLIVIGAFLLKGRRIKKASNAEQVKNIEEAQDNDDYNVPQSNDGSEAGTDEDETDYKEYNGNEEKNYVENDEAFKEGSERDDK